MKERKADNEELVENDCIGKKGNVKEKADDEIEGKGMYGREK